MPHRHGPGFRRRRIAALAAAPLIALTGAAGASAASGAPGPQAVRAAAPVAASVTVNAATKLAAVPATAIGINGSTYDADLTDAAVPGLLHTAGVDVVRFPGGTESDEYDWKTNTDVSSGATQPVDFDQFATLLSQSGAQGMVTVNYGTGDTVGATRSPKETGAQVAADWVQYANIQHHDGIKYWEIGNEVYGNGTYGADWEPDAHCTGSSPTNCGPAVYAQNVKTYIAAMKAVDPTIVVGVVLTAPGNWPDGQTSAGSPQAWDQTVLSALGSQIGFADVHWYPQNPSSVTPPGPTDAGLLGDTSQIPSMVSTLRSELTQYTGSSSVPIMITETNSVSSNPGKQTVGLVNALYLDQDYVTWLESGVANVDWWQIHNGLVATGDNGSGLYGSAAYGDYGVLSDATCGTIGGSQVCEPAADTPFPAYYGLDLLGSFIQPGSTLVSASSSQSLVQSYAATESNGDLRVLLVNDDPTNSYTVSLNYAGFTPASGAPTVATLSGTGTAITSATQGSAASQTIAPYSATVIDLHPGTGGGTPPTTPGTPVASAITSTGATLTWTASTDSAGVAGYDVLNASNTVIASTTTNTVTLSGLTPSTQYVLRVRARDAAGDTSAPSAAVTFTTAAAATGGTCKVAYSVQDWGGGFTGSITLTNTGATTISAWTLKFTWPGTQQITNDWSATWTQSGSQVTAVNLSYNGTLAPGAGTQIGFNASYTGTNSPPTSFTVNGAACTTG
jgi:Cellulose binding domain/Fibronectin type III domain